MILLRYRDICIEIFDDESPNIFDIDTIDEVFLVLKYPNIYYYRDICYIPGGLDEPHLFDCHFYDHNSGDYALLSKEPFKEPMYICSTYNHNLYKTTDEDDPLVKFYNIIVFNEKQKVTL